MGCLRNPRHEIFARQRALLVDSLSAYKAAGYTSGSDLYRRGNAARLDSHPKIRERIRELVKNDEELVELEAKLLRRELKRIGYADAVDLWEWNGDRLVIKNLTELAPEIRATIGEIAVEPIVEYEGTGEERHKVIGGQKIKVKQHDKLAALKQLAQLLGVEKPAKLELSGNGNPFVVEIVRFSDKDRPREL